MSLVSRLAISVRTPAIFARCSVCCRARGTDRNWTRVDRKICGRRRHRQANSVRLCSPASRRVASLRPRSAGLPALTPAPRTLVQTGSCRRCLLIHPLPVVVDVLSRMTPFPVTVDRCAVPRSGSKAVCRGSRFRSASSKPALNGSEVTWVNRVRGHRGSPWR